MVTAILWEANDGWRWKFKAANHEIIGESGEAFDSKSNAERALQDFTSSISLGMVTLNRVSAPKLDEDSGDTVETFELVLSSP